MSARWLIGLALLCSCSPTLRGQCKTDGDCPSGTACLRVESSDTDGLCIATTQNSPDAGGCTPSCGTGEQCVNALCTSSEPAAVAILSPSSGATVGSVPLLVTVSAHAPAGVSGIEVQLTNLQGSVQTVTAMAGTSPDTYEAALNLGASGVSSGAYDVVALMMTPGGPSMRSASVAISVDQDGPTVRIDPIPYPAGGAQFLRSDTIEIDADISDSHGGLGTTPPQLSISGMAPVNGTLSTGETYVFTFSGRLPPFAMMSGNVSFEITATNVLGSVTTATGDFAMTRLRWTWTKPRAGTIVAAPTLSQGLVVVGSEDGYVYGIDSTTGAQSWEVSVSSSGAWPVGHLTTGASNVYAALSDGHLVALNPASGSSVFQCPIGSGGFGAPALHPLTTGFSLGTTQDTLTGNASQETLFAFSTDGYVEMYRQSAFPSSVGSIPSCLQDSGSLSAQNDASPPTLVQDSQGIHLFFADDSGVAHAMTVALGQPSGIEPATYSMTQDWHETLGLPIHGGVAYGALASGTGLVAARQDSVVDGLGLSGMLLWVPPVAALPANTRSTPVLGLTDIFVQDGAGNLGAASQSNGVAVGTSISTNSPISSSTANAAPIATADGRVYFASGTQLFSVSPAGAVEWSFQPTPLGTSSTTYLDVVTPELDCAGTLYVVAADQDHGLVHAVITDSVSGLANSPWPRAFHDSHNTLNAATVVPASATCAD